MLVGLGWTGGILAKELTEAGVKVVALERGGMRTTGAGLLGAADPRRAALRLAPRPDAGHRARDTLTIRNNPSQEALPMREIGSFKPGECVGGAGVHWSGVHVALAAWDFETRSRTRSATARTRFRRTAPARTGASPTTSWSRITTSSSTSYGVSAARPAISRARSSPAAIRSKARARVSFRTPPTKPTYAGALFAQAAKSLGYTPFPSPYGDDDAALHQSLPAACWRNASTAVFASSYGCEANAKASPLTTVLPALLKHPNFELRTLRQRDQRVNLDSEKKRAVSVTYVDARGEELEQPAELVILASYTFNNTRLMLLSGIGKPYDPVSNQGVVGRNYSYQTGGKVSLFFEDKEFNPFMAPAASALLIDDFNGDNFDHTGLGFIGGSTLSGGRPTARADRLPAGTPGTPRWGSAWKKAVAK